MHVENVEMNELQVAINTIDGIRLITDSEGTKPSGAVTTPEEATNHLHEGLGQLRTELSKFMDTAFITTGKILTKERKDNLAIISEGLTHLKKEFRLPSRVDVKPSESKRANEAWMSFKNRYLKMAKTLLNTTQELSKGSSEDVATTIAWPNEDINSIKEEIQKATKEILLIGIFVKHLYGRALTKAQMEFGHRPYSQAFEALKKHKVSQRLKSAKRKARQSTGNRKEAIHLLEIEQKLFIEVVDKWDKECERWETKKDGLAKQVLEEQHRILDKMLGVSNLEAIFPGITELATDFVTDMLSFIPEATALEDGLPSHSQEAEEIADKIEEELDKIRETLGQDLAREELSLPTLQSTPKQRVRFEENNSVLSHDNMALNNALRKLSTAYSMAKDKRNEESREFLKATAEMAKSKKLDMNIGSGTEEEVREAYTSMEELDDLLTRVTAYVSLEEKRDQRKREEEKTKGILAAKSMPVAKIPAFTGKREDFWEWFSQIKAASPDTLPSEARAGHLRQAIKDLPTQEIIKGCQTYEEMEDELRRHFGSKEDELNRLVAQVDLIPRPKNKYEESFNFETLRRIARKLRAMQEEGALNKLKLGTVALQSFLPRTNEEWLKELHERKEGLMLDYSVQEGLSKEEVKNMALREQISELEISEEDYCSTFWRFLETKAGISRAMTAQMNATGPLMASPKHQLTFRSNRIEAPQESSSSPTRPWVRKCMFQNCLETGHFSTQCKKNLTNGEISKNILQLCRTSRVCVRCLRSLDYTKHDETCIGSYKRRSDSKWIDTDCQNENCKLELANGRKINLNKRICHHAIERSNARKGQTQATEQARNPTNHVVASHTNSNEEIEEWEYEIPSAIVCNGTPTVISNKLVVNDRNCGEASQLVEWLPVQGSEEAHPVLAMYDLGTSCSVIDNGLAHRLGLKKERVRFTISTVTGVQDGSDLYSFSILNSDNKEIKVQALGIDIRQHYPMTKIKVRKPWITHFKGQSYQQASGGYLGLLLGSDQSGLHPRQVSIEQNEMLWRSFLTGRYLITGGRNEMAGRPTINKISVAVPRDSPKKVNLSAKVTNSKIQNGEVITMVEDMKDKVFKQLAGMDAVLVTPCTSCPTCKSQTDRMAEQDLLEYEALRKTVSFKKDSQRYKGDFLYLEDKVKLIKGNSLFAKGNSEKLHKKLCKLPGELVKDFDESLDCAKEMGALQRTSEVEGLDQYPQRHIPINFAFSGKESSTKIRPTFNCGWSAGGDDLSFNDVHLTGPRNLNNLDQSMVFFKTNVIVGLVDVKKFFWTCLVSTKTASLNRVWLPKGGYSETKEGHLELEEWCWTTLTFGQAGAPALSGVIRHQAADDFCQIEEVKKQVKEKALVDDILIGSSSKDQFEKYQKDVEHMLQSSGMNYHKWVVSGVKSKDVVDLDQEPIKEGAKIFGYLYDQGKDCFVLSVKVNLTKANRGKKFGPDLEVDEDAKEYISIHKLTYRKTLGFTLSLWDLTGWLLPLQMLLRLMYRELLEDHQKGKWDDDIPEDYKSKYASLFKRLLTFDGITWDRAVVPTVNWDEEWGCRLATFFDGSKVASVAYTYIVTKKLDGSFHSRLLWAKGRLGSGSVPRNELGAAFLAVKINNFLEKYLQIRIRDITYFGDSQAVLYQIASRSILYDSWARARLRAIQHGSRGSTWLYIPANENVADIGSKNSSRINRETLESDFYQRGNFLEEAEWKGIQLGSPPAETLAGLPEIKKCYRSSPITLLNTYTILEDEGSDTGYNIEKECLQDLEETYIINANTEGMKDSELEILCNNMLGKYKKTQRITKINKNMEKDGLPEVLAQANKRLERKNGEEYFSQLLLKYRSFRKIERILTLTLRWRYKLGMNYQERVKEVLTRHAAIATVRYLCKKGVSFGPLRVDNDNRVWCKNRRLLGQIETKVLPEETLVLAPTTCLAKLIARSYHDDNHQHASTAIQNIIRQDLNVRIPNLLRMLEFEESQCTKCRHHRRTPYKPEEAGVPLQRHNLRNKPFTSICIDGIGPFKVKSLHRNDRREGKVWALIAVDQPTGLSHISILMDSSSHSVQVALESLKVEWNVEIDLITLDPAKSFVGLVEDGLVAGDGFDIEDIQNKVLKAGYRLKISPPKASWFQALCEKRVDMIKQSLYFQPKQSLNVIELELILKKIVLVINNKPVLLRQNQDNFVSISRMDLLGKFYNAPTEGMFRSSKAILKDIELIDECVQECRRIFNAIYTERLRDYSKWKYEGVIPKVGDIVGVPDKEVYGEPRMGRIIEMTSQYEVQVLMARPRRGHPYPEDIVTTRKVIFHRSPHSLYLIERPTQADSTTDMRKVEAGVELHETTPIEEIIEGENQRNEDSVAVEVEKKDGTENEDSLTVEVEKKDGTENEDSVTVEVERKYETENEDNVTVEMEMKDKGQSNDSIVEEDQTIDTCEWQVQTEERGNNPPGIDADSKTDEEQLKPTEDEVKGEEMSPKLGRGMRKKFPTKF